jgi:Na+/H+-dicarboxylate symporter
LLGLLLGLVVGGVIVWSNAPAGRTAASVIEPIGTIWVNALRMTIVPLVVSLLVSTVASSGGGAMFGQLGRRTLIVFLVLLIAIGLFGLLAAPPLYSFLDVDPAAAASLRQTAAENMPKTVPPTFASWFSGLVPSNVMQAASDGAMLPLIVFALVFGLALTRVDAAYREPVVTFFRAIAGAMLAVVEWVLRLAPLGAFALAVTVATHLGNASANVILFYIVTHCGLLVVVALAMYAIIPLITRTPLGRYARALLPAQVVVITTRSSLAALPVMLDKTVAVLGVPERIASFTLPLGVSLLRAQTGLAYIVYALFLGKLYGIPLAFGQVAFIGAMGILMSFSVPGIPSGGLLIAAPYFQAIGLPAQGIGILIALDAIPDIFKTLVIVQSHVSATLIAARGSAPDYVANTADQYAPS